MHHNSGDRSNQTEENSSKKKFVFLSDYISLILLYKDLLHDQLLMGTRRKNACLSCLRCYKMFKFVQNTNVLFKKKKMQ